MPGGLMLMGTGIVGLAVVTSPHVSGVGQLSAGARIECPLRLHTSNETLTRTGAGAGDLALVVAYPARTTGSLEEKI